MWEPASRASPALGLRSAAMPFLEDLHAVVGHHAQTGVLEPDPADVQHAELLGTPWTLLYGGRTRSSMAFLPALEKYGERVEVRPQDE